MRISVAKFISISLILLILNLEFTLVSDAQLTGRKFLEKAVAIWTFEEAGMKGIPDITGNGHNAKLINKPALVDGKFGRAIEFSDTRKNYLEVPDDVGLNLEEVISISVWVKRPPRLQATDVAPYFIIHRGGEWQWHGAGYGIALHKVFDNMFYFWYENGFQGASGIKDDQWHHYVVVAKDGERAPTLYIDGEAKPVEHGDGVKKMGLTPPLGQPMYIGALLPARFDSFSKSQIDELAIFNVALSDADVKQLGKGLDIAIFAVSPSGKLATSWATIKKNH
jgi:hypothetical protein